MMGKPKGADIVEGKITLPLIYALMQSNEKVKEHIQEIFNNGSVKKKHIEEIIALVEEKGGIEYTIKVAEDFKDKALNELKDFAPSPYKTALEDLTEYVIYRER